VGMQGGAGFKLWMGEVVKTIAESRGQRAESKELKEYADQLEAALNTTIEVTQFLLGKAAAGEVEKAFANSFAYMELFGTVTLAWCWLQQAQVASGKEGNFYRGKLEAVRYFFNYELEKVPMLAARLKRMDDVFVMPNDDWM
jgi:hypothetical protein